jgi:hypothetical protein
MEIKIQEIGIDRDGYTEYGAYLGIGAPVWDVYIEYDSGGYDLETRRGLPDKIVAHYQNLYPGASIKIFELGTHGPVD